jgi:hypothetical protein
LKNFIDHVIDGRRMIRALIFEPLRIDVQEFEQSMQEEGTFPLPRSWPSGGGLRLHHSNPASGAGIPFANASMRREPFEAKPKEEASVVPLSHLSFDRSLVQIYFVILNAELSVDSFVFARAARHSAQLAGWAARGEVMAVENPKWIPGAGTTPADVVRLDQAYLVKPDLSGILIDQRKSQSGILINHLKRGALPLFLKETKRTFCVSDCGDLDLAVESVMKGRCAPRSRSISAAGIRAVSVEDKSREIELVIVPGGAVLRDVGHDTDGEGWR